MINKIKKNLFYLLIIISAFQFSFWGVFEPVYSVLRAIIILITILLFCLLDIKSIIKSLITYKLIRYQLYLIITFFILCVFYFGFGLKIDFSPLRDLFVISGFIIISVNLDFNMNEIKNIFFLYSFLYLCSILSIVVFLGNGFVISDLYLPVPKNQLAPGYAVGAMISLYSIFNDKKRVKYYILFFVLYIISLLVLRSRTTIFALFIVMLLFLFFEFKDNKKVKYFFISTLAISILIFHDFIINSLFQNVDTSNINSISTGRMERNLQGLNFLDLNLFFGETLNGNYGNKIIHNYLLKNLVAFGLIAFIPILLVYINFVVIIIKSFFDYVNNYYKIGVYLLTLMFIVSLSEYSFPFSPVSATFFSFFVFINYIKFKNKNENISSS